MAEIAHRGTEYLTPEQQSLFGTLPDDSIKLTVDSESDSEDESEPEPDEPVIKPVKVGGKGKARKGTVASGGVAKRTAGTSAPKPQEKTKAADEDWRPSPEEYKKMSSKEKRQLRNKISARNFRVRRKGE